MKRLLALLLSLLMLVSACKKSSNPVEVTTPTEAGGNIVTGPSVDAATQVISTGGGTIKIVKAGDPLDGFELTVLPNSFTQTQSIKVSYAQITSHQLGSNFNPISPLIHIEYDGSVSNRPMNLKIPVKVTSGRFAMPFLFDKNTGNLVAMLVQEIGTDYVLVSTRHFSPTGLLAKRSGVTITYADIAVSDIDEARLAAQNIIDSRYRPGTDDWEFPNWGSYIAPDGHCAGQAITSMWYYIEKKQKGASSLFHLLDQVNDPTKPSLLWQDNPRGYRFASTIQQDFNFADWLDDVGAQTKHPDVTFKAFSYSMLVTKEPQLVLIARTSPDTAAHAMVVYEIDYPNKKLYVADPNYPGNRSAGGTISERVINYTNNKLGPYTSGPTAANVGTAYDLIGFYPKTAYIGWSQITQGWVGVENGTIGNVGSDRFPSYTLYLDKIGGNVLADNYTSFVDTLKVLCRSTDCTACLAGNDGLQQIDVYNDQGSIVGFQELDWPDLGPNYANYFLELNPGKNKFGFYIMGAEKGQFTYYVDFKWITINYNQITITINPNPLNGQTNTEYTFSVNITGTPPSNVKYVWNFGDNTGDVTVQNSATAKHTFSKEGIFDVKCSMYDNSNSSIITSATSKANILSAFLRDVLASNSATVSLQADFKSSSVNNGLENHIQFGNAWAQTLVHSVLIWSGLSFSANYAYGTPPYAGTDSGLVIGSVAGTISSDGKTISTYSATEHQGLKSGTGSWIELKIEVKNLPFSQTTSAGNVYRNSGPSVASNVTSVSIKKWVTIGTSQQYELVTISSVDYNSTSTVPDLYILMNK